MRFLVLLAATLVAGAMASVVQAKDPIALKRVAFDDFMQHTLSVGIPGVAIVVPKDYEAVKVQGVPADNVYWMRSADGKRANRSGDLPTDNGWMSGRISADVGYDVDADEFTGMEDAYSKKLAEKSFTALTMARVVHAGVPMLVVRMTARESAKRIFGLYVATKHGTDAAFITFRPPGNDAEFGEFVWHALEQELAKGGP